MTTARMSGSRVTPTTLDPDAGSWCSSAPASGIRSSCPTGASSNSWRAAIVRSRDKIARLARKMPTLAAHPATQLAEVYPDALHIAEAETGLSGLPEACPWPIEQVLARDFWPE